MINGFIAQIRQELPLFRGHIDKGIDAITRTVPIYIEIHRGTDNPHVIEVKDSIVSMRDAMKGMIAGMEEFHDSFGSFSRLSTDLVRSTREARNIIQEIITVARGGIESLEQALQIVS